MAKNNSTRIILGPQTRWSYVNVWEPKSIDGSNPKYSVQFLIPKTDQATLDKVRAAIEAAYHEGEAKLKGGSRFVPALEDIKSPLRDGDRERKGDPVYAGMYFLNANSTQKPGIVDRDLNEILDPDEVYSGCWGRASINFYAFNVNGNRGVGVGLNNIQKLKDGDRLGGARAKAEDDFGDDFEDDEDDF